jgi:hypothetical protein
MWLANDGNYREMRHFTPWLRPRETEMFHLPKMLAEVQGETHVLFGDAVISTPETAFGAETCVSGLAVQLLVVAYRLAGRTLYSQGSAYRM